MAHTKRVGNAGYIVEKYRDADGKQRTRTLCRLGVALTVEGAIDMYVEDIAFAEREIAECRQWLADRSKAMTREVRHDLRKAEKLLETSRERLAECLAYLESLDDA